MIPPGSIDDFGRALEGPPLLDCWECVADLHFFHDAHDHEQHTGHTVCDPKGQINEYSCGCALCGDRLAIVERQRPKKRPRVTWRR
jgi:hypothetical protein